MTQSSEVKRRVLKLYTPHSGQRKVHESKTRFNIVCFGRQSGKTTYGLNKVMQKAWTGPKDGIYWYVLQTYDAAKVAFNRLLKVYMRCPSAFSKKPHETDLSAQFVHGPMIYFKSGKNFEDLRIETLDGVVLDEYRQQHPDLWPLVIRPMLSHKKGWADVLSTANGFEHFYDLVEKAKVDSEWAYFNAPSWVAPWWDESEVLSAKKTMSQAQFDQEIGAEFRDLTKGKAYGCYGAWNESYESPWTSSGLVHPLLPVGIALDFNVAPMAWTMIQYAGERQFYAFDMVYIEQTTRGTFEAALELRDRLVQYGIKKVTIVGDASGKARKTSASGDTDYAILCGVLDDSEIEWENRTPDANPGVKDRVNCTNAHLKNALEQTTFQLHPVNCAPLRKDFQRCTWKTGTGILDQTTDKSLTHSSDGVGYFLHEIAPLTLFEDSFEVRVIQ